MRRHLSIAILAILAGALPAQSLWNPKLHSRPLASDTTARGMGDIVTIVIDEVTKVENDEQTKLEKTSSLSAVLSNFDILPDMFNTLPKVDGNQTRTMDGKAQYDKDNSLKSRISVLVQDVMPNGVLVIEGTRKVAVDGETKIIKIRGLIRPQDVRRDNTVSSTSVAEATVSYEGTGFMTQTTTRGWFSWILDWVWPF